MLVEDKLSYLCKKTYRFFSFSWLVVAAFRFRLAGPFESFIVFKHFVTSRTICFQSVELSVCH